MNQHYGNEFYAMQMDGSYRSARRYVEFLYNLIQPRSVVDVGCGRGTWLKACLENGANLAVGIDGPWNTSDQMIDNRIDFRGADLTKPLPVKVGERFDLAMSLEVAEHLPEVAAHDFVKSLSMLSDAILFGAAFSHQGGTNHINEQKHSYWAALFAQLGYQPLDLFRPAFWDDEQVEFWYRQNTFLYVKSHSNVAKHFSALGHMPLKTVGFMDCVHPILFEARRFKNEVTSDQILQWTGLLLEKHPRFASQFEALINQAKLRSKS